MKGQEEIMGFLLIVVMVIVIGFGMLFFFTPKTSERADVGLENLLYSWLSVTVGDKDIRAIISDCSGACNLNEEIIILDSAIEDSGLMNTIKGYTVNVTGSAEFSYSKGNLTGNARTALVPINKNEIQLKVFYQ